MNTDTITAHGPLTISRVAHAAELPADWDALLGPEDALLSRRWLDVVEGVAGVPMRYLMLRRGDTLLAAVATARADAATRWGPTARPHTLLERQAAAGEPGATELLAELLAEPPAPAEALLPALIAGGRHVGTTRILHHPRAGEAELVALVAEIEAIAVELEAGCAAFLFVDEQDALLRTVLADRGYRSFRSGRYSRLPVPGDGFAGLLATLPRKRQVSVKAERRRVAEHRMSIDLAPLDVREIDELAFLECQLTDKYGVALEPGQAAAKLHEIHRLYGDDALVLTARTGSTIRGFALLVGHQDRWYARHCGFDYAYQREHKLALYFELLFYRLVEEAAARGVRAVHYGLGSEQAKASRGAVATDQHCFLRRLS
ncbi:GNAT family N-acetyltransferase [Kitasatospora sp. NPDC058190]|uniref:GNAT family N-acetyltransferase n=1 Tax=Kitasatospora sp. NPDC058190 TaxID=3346371 RepID=UPI0036DE9EC9